MKHVSHLTLCAPAGILAGILIVVTVLQAVPAAEPAQAGQAAGLPDTPATPLFVRVCGDCHDVQRVISRRRTRAEWLDTIRQMIEDGAEASEEEFDVVLEFLLSNSGAVAINTAKAEDLVTVLGIGKKDADAIVSYRAAKGPFADFAAVRAVPEIDISKLEQRKDSLRF
jgi:competence protein ComEA